jgi:proton-translocating NADH-quinone oxidoreductase chain N
MDVVFLKSFLPEFFLSVSILFQLVWNIRLITNLEYNYPIIEKEVFYQTIIVLVGLFFLISQLRIEGHISNFLFINDESTRTLKIALVIVCLFILGVVQETFSLEKLNFFEFFTIFLIALLSLLLLISSSDLISFYLIIELQSLCFYILASFKRDSSFSTEAGLKYFISGAFISGLFLFGCSILYGCLGTLNLNALSLIFSFSFANFDYELKAAVLLGVMFITITLLFKIACAPFHFWSPDVYEGSPLSSTVLFSIIPKISLIHFSIKWISLISLLSSVNNFLLYCGVFSTIVGTFYALSQNRLKKLIIYSSIAQIGFLVVGLSLNTLNGYISVLFFLCIYIATSILIWSHFSLFYLFQYNTNSFFGKESSTLFLSSLTNLFSANKLWALSFVIIFFSIGGIPPLTGFLSKIFILSEVVNNLHYFCAFCLIVVSSISVFYYIRIVKVMFFEPTKLENYYEQFQTVFYYPSLDNVYLIISLLLSFLLITFFIPTNFLLCCQYVVLSISSL